MSASGQELSEYEIQRRHTIERNRRKLVALGLLGGDTAAALGSRGVEHGRASSGKIRGKSAQGGHTAGMIATAEPVRRSLRNQGKVAPVYKDHSVGFDDRQDAVSYKRPRPPASGAAAGTGTADSAAVAAPPRQHTSCKPLAPDSSRMSGVTEWKNAVFLWVNVGEEGGGYTNLFKRTATEDGADHHPVASSVQNTALPPGTQSGVANAKRVRRRDGAGMAPKGENREDGAESSGSNSSSRGAKRNGFRMTWFAGSRMTVETPAIRRLLRAGMLDSSAASATACNTAINAASGAAGESVNPGSKKSTSKEATERTPTTNGDVAISITPAAIPTEAPDTAASAGDSSSTSAGDDRSEDAGGDALLLFCRLPKEPYVFCGRLGYADHWPGERPVRFLWRLLDAERLAGFEDFAAVVRAAGVDVE